METASDRYIREHSTAQGEALEWIERQTHIRTNYPRMLSGSVQGRLLTMVARMCKARDILEIGSFTGYSAACLAMGLEDGGRLDALEVNDELEDLMREGWERAGVADKVTLHIGDAKETLKALSDRRYDLVFIDANKREYSGYYNLVFDLVRPGGVIIADDVLWDGKLWSDPPAHDAQTLGLKAFNDMVAADPRVEVVVLPLRDDLSLIRKK